MVRASSASTSTETRPIVFFVFERYRVYTLNWYWRSLLTSFSTNNFPPRITYTPREPPKGSRYSSKITKKNSSKKRSDEEGVLTFTTEDKHTRRVHLTRVSEGEEPNESEERKIEKEFKLIVSLSRECGYSPKRDLDLINRSVEKTLYEKWKSVPARVKIDLKSAYVSQIKTRYGLSPSEVKQLQAVLQLGFQFQALTAKDIIFKSGRIQKINGVLFDSKSRLFQIKGKSKYKSSSQNPRKDKLQQLMEKYLQSHVNRRAIL